MKERQLQELIIDYFKKTDNATLSLFIDSFVYHQPISEHNGISKIIDRFLKDNGIVNAYLNYVIDYKEVETASWLKSSMSQRAMIDNIKQALLNLAFNRFRNIKHEVTIYTPQVKPKKQPDKIKILGTADIEKSVHIVSNLTESYTLCSIMIDGSFTGDTEKTEDAVDCEHCKSIVKHCKNIDL